MNKMYCANCGMVVDRLRPYIVVPKECIGTTQDEYICVGCINHTCYGDDVNDDRTALSISSIVHNAQDGIQLIPIESRTEICFGCGKVINRVGCTAVNIQFDKPVVHNEHLYCSEHCTQFDTVYPTPEYTEDNSDNR